MTPGLLQEWVETMSITADPAKRLEAARIFNSQGVPVGVWYSPPWCWFMKATGSLSIPTEAAAETEAGVEAAGAAETETEPPVRRPHILITEILTDH
ncbi:hypothetical protein [Desulfatibacillum aliphaticivorans]|uniref:Uncharacterized protein n=1 Tax=Desulfatibacillum aliphaticivorans TaxID=218208 RepID=B8FDP9_DESAL|nr:hypothetical protein [Desulfatibacillum aliphaticivorans]ACL06680.1 hypothetical protein Dalk_5009 [Desulfatibacillum aliphaticivorans]